jgi:CDP-diacylglycerol--glycerol-3-phosphate 3-phosphatidyltransferase
VTTGERPTRIIVAAVTLAAGGLVASHAETVALVGASAGSVTSVAGLVQLALAARRRRQR